jgi:chromosomal replication initiation ATPase DnaA
MKEKKYTRKFLDALFASKVLRLKGQPSYVRDRITLLLVETSKEYNMTHPVELFTDSLEWAYVKPRRVALTLIRDVVDLPFSTIAVLFGFKDHTAPLHAYHLVRAEMDAGPSLCRTVRNILQSVDKIEAEKEAEKEAD